jgi:hypothetical protein
MTRGLESADTAQLLNTANMKVESLLDEIPWQAAESNTDIQSREVKLKASMYRLPGNSIHIRQYRSAEDKRPFRNVLQVISRSGPIALNSGWHPEGFGELHNINDADEALTKILSKSGDEQPRG